MKPRSLLLALGLLISTTGLYAQTNLHEQLIFPYLPLERQSNLVVLADWDHPKPCPPEYTNLLSNTNLFTLAEQRRIKELTLKYQNVTSNVGPPGTIFRGWQSRRWTPTNMFDEPVTFRVACFDYTNSAAKEEIESLGDIITAKYRTSEGDGYTLEYFHNCVGYYAEYKGGVLDGLCVGLNDPNSTNTDNRCAGWSRFHNGLAVGKLFHWDEYKHNLKPITLEVVPDGYYLVEEVDFKEPFDLIKYETVPLELSWEEVPTNSTNVQPINGKK